MKLPSCCRALLSAFGGRFWLQSEGKVCRPDLVSDGITPQVEPPSTSSEVYPPLSKPTLGVGTDVKVFRPLSVGQCIGIWVGYPGLSAVMELGFVAQTTVGARC